ncbi:Eukaryotic translation initiation factor 3 subunit L [Nymphon striatum]|nr:Eukaryotic translation initiation factor 3 subunit L [Nymphon striatum]
MSLSYSFSVDSSDADSNEGVGNCSMTVAGAKCSQKLAGTYCGKRVYEIATVDSPLAGVSLCDFTAVVASTDSTFFMKEGRNALLSFVEHHFSYADKKIKSLSSGLSDLIVMIFAKLSVVDPYNYPPTATTGGDYEMHTGDPRQDLEYEKAYSQFKVPDQVKNFLIHFSKTIRDQEVFQIKNLYEVSFNKLSDTYFKNSPWPEAEDIIQYVGNEQIFLILYKELYYRHIYAKVQGGPTLEQRFESYFNYCNLFNCILRGGDDEKKESERAKKQIEKRKADQKSYDKAKRRRLIQESWLEEFTWAVVRDEKLFCDICTKYPSIADTKSTLFQDADGPIPLELPHQWLWETIDEFIYQFQSFSLYRKSNKKSENEMDMLKNSPKIWNVHSVLNVLHSLVDKSNINRQLEVYSSGGNPDSVAGDFGHHSLYKMLGYFSLVGLLRLHSLLGDYYQAIKVLENIELNKKSLYSRVPACQITTYYYVGFAYLMMRRYADTIRTYSNILLYIQRTKQMFQQKTYQCDQINKQTEQMYTLLAICLVLHPQRIDESVHSQLKEKFADRMQKMQKGDTQEFENAFTFACPKFLSPVPPTYDGTPAPGTNKEPFNLQLAVFLEEVQQQINLPTIRSFLKLYTAMPISQLAAYMGVEEESFRSNLLCFKHKMKNVVWTKGTSGLEGEFQSGSELDFYVDKDMIHIADTKVARRYGDFFIRQIHKFHEMNNMLSELKH